IEVAAFHSFVEGGFAGVVAGAGEPGVAGKFRLDSSQVTGPGGLEEACQAFLDWKPAGQDVQQKLGDLIMPAGPRPDYEGILEGIGSVIEVGSVLYEIADDFQVSLANGKVQRRSVVVFAADQFGAPFGESFDPVEVTITARAQHRPYVVILQVGWTNHV